MKARKSKKQTRRTRRSKSRKVRGGQVAAQIKKNSLLINPPIII